MGYGTYVLYQYSIHGNYINDISLELELNPNILRYLITKINKEDLCEKENELENKEEVNNSIDNNSSDSLSNKSSDIQKKQDSLEYQNSPMYK